MPSVVLPFDDEELVGTTVAEVLTDPARFEGTTLADPLEGVDYGRTKAKIMRRANGEVWINSFAHGKTVYELKWDAASVETAVNKAPARQAADTFIRLAIAADLDAEQMERLRDLAAQRAGVGKRAIGHKLEAARAAHAGQRTEEERNRRAAERRDPRPPLEAPAPDAEWLPQMKALNEVLSKSRKPIPPARDIDGDSCRLRRHSVPQLHLLATSTSNHGEP